MERVCVFTQEFIIYQSVLILFILETQSISHRSEHKAAGPSCVSTESEHWGGPAGGQVSRPRALSQSAVHSPERREEGKDLVKVWSEMRLTTA